MRQRLIRWKTKRFALSLFVGCNSFEPPGSVRALTETNFLPAPEVFILLVRGNLECYFPSVSTLAEIEAAADALPIEQKKESLDFLASRVNGDSGPKQLGDLREFAGTVQLSQDPLAWQQRIRGEHILE